MLHHNARIRVAGFALFEMLPASLLLAVAAAACLKFLSVNRKLEQLGVAERRIGQSYERALEHWHSSTGDIILCSLSPGSGWTTVDLPDESWLPGQADGPWICWKQVRREEHPVKSVDIVFRRPDMSTWETWTTRVDWRLASDEPSTAAQP